MTFSEKNEKIVAALLAFQEKVGPIKKTAFNPAFKSNYVTLDAILDEVVPILNSLKVALIQSPAEDGYLETTLMHESGQFVSSRYKMVLDKASSQGLGSAITYSRRYVLGSMLALSFDVDDDANTASGITTAKPAYTAPKTEELQWLAENSPEFVKVVQKIQTKVYKSIFDVRKDYKVSAAIAEKLFPTK